MRRKSPNKTKILGDFLGPSPRKALLFWAQKMQGIFLRIAYAQFKEAILDA